MASGDHDAASLVGEGKVGEGGGGDQAEIDRIHACIEDGRDDGLCDFSPALFRGYKGGRAWPQVRGKIKRFAPANAAPTGRK